MSFVIRDVRVFTGEETIENGFVSVEDGKIKAVGKISDIPNNIGSIVISKPNHTLLPGLIDAHVHSTGGHPQILLQSLRFGVTTVCELHSEPEAIAKIRELQKQPDTADYKTAGLAATIEGGWPAAVVLHDPTPELEELVASWPKLKTKEDVEAYLDMNEKACKPDFIKLMHESGKAMGMTIPHPTYEFQKIIIDAAHARGYMTICHCLALDDTLEVLRAGVDGLAHCFFDQPPTPELIEAYKQTNAWLNPTLNVVGSLTTEGKSLQEKFRHDPRADALLSEELKDGFCNCLGMATSTSKQEYAFEAVRQLKAAGIDIVCGSDATSHAIGTTFGLSLHQELYLFVKEVGMTPTEALRSATSVTARRFGFSDRGRLAAGLNADLLLVEGNPMADIDDTLNLRGVWRDGVLSSTFKDNF